MPILASSLVPGLAEMVALEEQMRAEGKTCEEIDTFMAKARLYDWEVITADLRKQGRSEKAIGEFWLSLIPGDDPDSVDV
jgi:hypothetical protein